MWDTGTRSTSGLLTLLAVRGVGPATAIRLADRFETLEEIGEAEPRRLETLVRGDIAKSLQDRGTWIAAYDRARRTIERANSLDVDILSVFDDCYPNAYRALDYAPAIVYVKGTLSSSRCVACIGTREPSEFGQSVSAKLVDVLVQANWSIVSGLAIGVDTLCHEAALRRHGTTIAIMAGGLDSIYPKQNGRLADEILDTGGALLSEQPFGVPATGRNLVQRDRLQSGLSIATVVMQTDIKGGSMHTVRYTLTQNRLLFAPVPQARHAEEDKSQGILAMTALKGPAFADEIGAEGEYRRLLLRDFRDRTPATPLFSRGDYDAMLEALSARLASLEASNLTAPAATSGQLSML